MVIRQGNVGKGPAVILLAGVLFFSTFLVSAPGVHLTTNAADISVPMANQTANSTPARYDVGFNMTEYHSYEQVQAMIIELSEDHPDIMRVYSLGKTYEGRDLWAVKLSDNPGTEEKDEPEVLYIGLHHAREWSSVEVVMYFLHFMVKFYGQPPTDNDGDGAVNEDPFNGADDDGDGRIDEDGPESRVTWLVNNRQLWFIPIFNPDGLEFARKEYYLEGVTDDNTLWRKNREPNINPLTGNPFPEYVGGNAMWGTDLNRNYGWHWGEVGYQGYVDPSREDYAGPWDTKDDDNDRKVGEDNMDGIDNDGDGMIDEDARGGFSTFETKTLRGFLYDHNFKILMSYHTYKEQGTIYWPFMYTRELPPDEQIFRHLAEGMYVFNGYEYRNYTTTDNTRKGPLVDGDLNDYAYGALGILTYCIELKQSMFIVETEKLPQLEGENLGVNLYLAEVADAPAGEKFTFEHDPLKDTSSTDGPYTVKVRLNESSHASAPQLMPHGFFIRYSNDGGQTWHEEELVENMDGFWRADIPGQKVGTIISYFVEADTSKGGKTLSPSYAPEEVHSFVVVKRQGDADPLLTAAHVFFMIGGMIVLVPGIFLALAYLKTRKGNYFHRTMEVAGISTGMLFVGGFPLGWLVAYQEFGTPWTGIPFGWDITDNKTLLTFIYWSVSLFLVRDTLMKTLVNGKARFCPYKQGLKGLGKVSKRFDLWLRKERTDSITKAGFAKLFLIGTLLTLFVYLIPHSIQI